MMLSALKCIQKRFSFYLQLTHATVTSYLSEHSFMVDKTSHLFICSLPLLSVLVCCYLLQRVLLSFSIYRTSEQCFWRALTG